MPVSGTEAWIRYVEPLGLGHLELTPSGGLKVSHVTTSDGLATDAVFMLGRDHTGRIWAGGNKGVNVIERTGRIHTLSRADGLIWNDLSAEGFWADQDGSVYLGTSRGLVRFRAGDIDFKAVAMPCGHYTVGEIPFKFIDGWHLGWFIYSAFKTLEQQTAVAK